MTWETVFEQDAMVVVGATCWACYKTNPFFQGGEDAPCFDLIIIDEASQMTVTQGLLTMSYGNPGTTHYLIVGDNHQLPPIIQGNYETREGQPDLYHSIFQYYMDKQGTADYLKMLHLNFRMNEALSDYSAQKIYNKQKLFHGEKYLPYEDKKCTIGSQVLRMQDGWEKEELKNILDPKYPLVVVYLSGDTTGETEREKVAEIVELLQKYMLKKDGTHYSAEEFWQTAFGILSPYHRQIDALKAKIVEQYDKKKEEVPGNILIDTVDKLQGQEREAVVVSYGVNDAEEAVAQGDFIYSYRRLNVSLTRGKKKTIVFLTDELTDYPIELLGSTDEDLLKGVSFVCGLRRYMEDDENGFEAEKITENKPGSKVTVDIYRKRKVRH
jgi:superfamily I DNA and/or RNA helicase